ncbi:MAG: hypothetical protein Ta2C_02760 [Candidatus Endomicrobiellum trichonymphae]|uniref:DUF7380 domain-containing protein n=1 Tax=Endomicrobium trichonymphae TaxID=1408204 RepID=UPI0027D43CEB|nr:MAG: hypothetical protein Ta2C_02760 [Candidatus Endomicrobium trichonymphae]
MKYYDEKKPHCPHYGGEGYISMIPEDISKEQAEELFRNLNKIESPYVKSRIADILWHIKKLDKNNIEAAKIAIKSYYKSVKYFVNNCKISEFFLKFAIGQLERLAIIILSLKDILKRDHIYNKLLEYLDNIANIEFISAAFGIFLRLKLSKEETKVVIEKLENLIKLLGDKIDGFSLRKLYSTGAEIAKKSGELDKMRSFKIIEADSFVEEADKINIRGWIIKSGFLKKAILLYQSIPSKKIELKN